MDSARSLLIAIVTTPRGIMVSRLMLQMKSGISLLTLWALLWGSAALAESSGDFKLYSASSSLDGKPVTVRLNTYSGDSWFFDGGSWQRMLETGSKNSYEEPDYTLSMSDSAQGLVLIRFSVRNGSAWIYTSSGWNYIKEP